ncbi:MAG: pyruvate formate-lyase-activating protein [Capsulimonadales bacterium]|nr:pyruvate formate-lyase-activating protein [Capsulimonadales bacterium]
MTPLPFADTEKTIAVPPQSADRPIERRGRIYGTESFGATDGPGIRFVVFMQGCPLRCRYCHNPDARILLRGDLRTVEDLMGEIRKEREFYEASDGGVTISGGEPLIQPEFVAELLRACRAEGIHTAVDTSGYADEERASIALKEADLVLLDLKTWDRKAHFRLTGVYPDRVHNLARYLAAIGKPVWLRFVLVPGLTDDPEDIETIARFAAGLGNVERVDVLPFHKMGEPKWERLGIPYTLKETPPPTPEQVASVVGIFRAHGLNAC